MNEPDKLLNLRVCVVGLGLMGGSMAMALRGKCASLIGVDCDHRVLTLACQLNLVDQCYESIGDSLNEADLIILATPVGVILEYLRNLPGFTENSVIVLDLGSTKVEITQAMQSLPKCYDPLGGHPMCGKEQSSLKNANRDLFLGAPFALTCLDRTSARARDLAVQIIQTIGANPIWINPDTHDHWVAATSHLPYLVANTLAFITPLESKPLVSTGFRSTTRLAATPPSIILDILISNQVNILSGLGEYRKQLEILEEKLRSHDFESVKDLLCTGASKYEELIVSKIPS